MKKLPTVFQRPVAAALMSGMVATVLSGVQTAWRTGIDSGLPLRWLAAFGFAFPIAFTTAFLVGPVVKKLTAQLVGAAGDGGGR